MRNKNVILLVPEQYPVITSDKPEFPLLSGKRFNIALGRFFLKAVNGSGNIAFGRFI
jgi:hypothetical protein